eukprot:689196-Alexandrium_andersonii.AAC.1
MDVEALLRSYFAAASMRAPQAESAGSKLQRKKSALGDGNGGGYDSYDLDFPPAACPAAAAGLAARS